MPIAPLQGRVGTRLVLHAHAFGRHGSCGNVVSAGKESWAGILARQRFGRGQDAPRSCPGKRRQETRGRSILPFGWLGALSLSKRPATSDPRRLALLSAGSFQHGILATSCSARHGFCLEKATTATGPAGPPPSGLCSSSKTPIPTLGFQADQIRDEVVEFGILNYGAPGGHVEGRGWAFRIHGGNLALTFENPLL